MILPWICLVAPSSLLAPRLCAAPAVETAGMPFQSPTLVVGGLFAFLCRPFLRWRRSSPGQLAVGQAFTGNPVHDTVEPAGIVGFAGIIPEGFFDQISEQMERFDTNAALADERLISCLPIESFNLDGPFYLA